MGYLLLVVVGMTGALFWVGAKYRRQNVPLWKEKIPFWIVGRVLEWVWLQIDARKK